MVCLLVTMLAWPLLAATTTPKRAPARPPVKRTTTGPRTPTTPRTAAPGPRQRALQLGSDARAFEEAGSYGLAADKLRAIRPLVAPDADLELQLALDEARSGQADSAWARLHGPVLTAALTDTANALRNHDYPFEREPLWVNGQFDGWNWYVARAIAELGIARGEPLEALRAAQLAIRARPLSGKDYLLAGLAAGRAGSMGRAAQYVQAARLLDPTLPEVHYLRGLLEWRSGRRAEAAESFRAAIARDSTWREPALARVRCQLPGATPDSIPTRFLYGARGAAELTSPVQPKIEEMNQSEIPVGLIHKDDTVVPDSLRARFKKPVQLVVTVLVDEEGRPILNELPWFTESAFPYVLVPGVVGATPNWRFRAARRMGRPIRAWASVEHEIKP